MKFPKQDSVRDEICKIVYKNIEILVPKLIKIMSTIQRSNTASISIGKLISNGTLILISSDTVCLHTDVRKFYDEEYLNKPNLGVVVPASSINKMKLPHYKPPKYEERRPGSMEYKSWKSTGGD